MFTKKLTTALAIAATAVGASGAVGAAPASADGSAHINVKVTNCVSKLGPGKVTLWRWENGGWVSYVRQMTTSCAYNFAFSPGYWYAVSFDNTGIGQGGSCIHWSAQSPTRKSVAGTTYVTLTASAYGCS